MDNSRLYKVAIRNYIPGRAACDRTLLVTQAAPDAEQAKQLALQSVRESRPFLFWDEQFEVLSCDEAEAG